MSKIDYKIGETPNSTENNKNNNSIFNEQMLKQEIQFLHSYLRQIENKRESQQKYTNTALTWIVIIILIYVIPDIIVNILQLFILLKSLQ